MQKKLALLASTTLAAFALATPADAAGSGWYVSVYGGANWQDDNSLLVSTAVDRLFFDASSDTGFVVGGAIGMSLNQFMQGLRVEAEVAYRQNDADGSWSSTDGAMLNGGALDYEHSSTSVMANVWYDFDVGGFRPYLGGGIGWADVQIDGTATSGDNPVLDYSDNGFAWQLGAGINFDISNNMKLGVGYRYFEGPDVTVAAPGTGNGLAADFESQNHTALVSLTFGL